MKQEDLQACRILVVDDEKPNVRVLESLLSRAGYKQVKGTTDPRSVPALYESFEPDLLLLDLRMPGMDGFEILRFLQEVVPEDEYFPILVLTGDLSTDTKERALSMGARDFVTKPFDLTEALLRIKNLLEARVLHLHLQQHNQTLEEKVLERTRHLAEAQLELLHRLAVAAEYRDDLTGRHAERVGLLSALIARELELPDEEIRLLRRAATLHDVGKIGVSDSILMKPGPLTSEEYDLMKRHTGIGERILSGSRFPLLQMAAEIAVSHHEWWNGKGYASGLEGEGIPITGRIVAVADVFDSLTHARPYKKAFPREEALGLIREGDGSQFDAQVVKAFMLLVERGVVDRLDEMVKEDIDVGADSRRIEMDLLGE
ncbi:MAG: HD domain-containing phosphohydrolase [Gemmatimonadota bacterium]